MQNISYELLTDSNSELPLELQKKHNLTFVPMPYTIEDEEYYYDLGENTDFKTFFNKIRNGSMPTTSTYPPVYYEELMRPILEQGKDILFISFSSQLSAAFSFLNAAKMTLQEEFPERTIRLVDTKRISALMAVLLIEVLEMYEAGKPLEEVAQWIENNYVRSHGYFTVDDLNHLKRGARISPTMAVVGSMMQVKPILTFNNDGKIISKENARGRKKSIKRLMELTVNNVEIPEESTLIVMHADCEDDARTLVDMIEEKVKFKKIYLQYVGPVIGSHCGPNTLASCFMGNEIVSGE